MALCCECVAVCSVHVGVRYAVWLGGKAVRQTGCEPVVYRDRGGGVAGQKTPEQPQLFPHCLHSSGLVTRPAY